MHDRPRATLTPGDLAISPAVLEQSPELRIDRTDFLNNASLVDAALWYAKNLGPVFPADTSERKSHKAARFSNGARWGATRDPRQIKRDFAKFNPDGIGLPTGSCCSNNTFVADIDTLEGHDVDGLASLRQLEAEHGPLPETLTDESPSGSLHLFFRAPDDVTIKSSQSKLAPGIDICGEGAMVLVAPSRRDGRTYRWRTGQPAIADAPDWLIELVKVDETSHTPTEDDAPADVDEVIHAAGLISNPDLGWGEWIRIGMALFNAVGNNKAGLDAFKTFSAKSKKYDEATTVERWEHFAEYPPSRLGVGTIFYLAELACPDWRDAYARTVIASIYAGQQKTEPDERDAEAEREEKETEAEPKKKEPQPAEPTGDDATLSPLYSDDYLALQLASRYGHKLRHVAKWGLWYQYDGTRWREDETLNVFTLARKLNRGIASTCNKKAERKNIASGKTVAATISLARSDPRIAARIDQWDLDPWALNTPEGTIDLQTGKMRKHRAADYLTKCTAVGPGGDCPRWKQFLKEVTADDEALQEYVQRLLGYGLTGSVIEHVLAFLSGTGSNGKSVLLKTVAFVLGDYVKAAPFETFTAKENENHPTELAMLRGARMVQVAETEKGKHWAESRIKSMTAGDPVSARFMRQDFFTYTPTFKILVAGNHKPGLSTVNVAIRRRLHIVPFNVTFTEDKLDKNLTERLKEEASGILSWMIDGCTEWQRDGLKPPPAVVSATAEYLATEDRITRWITDCVDLADPNAFELSTELFWSWQNWAEKAGEKIGSLTTLTKELKDRDHQHQHTKKGNGFAGMKVRVVEGEEEFNRQGQKSEPKPQLDISKLPEAYAKREAIKQARLATMRKHRQEAKERLEARTKRSRDPS